MLAKMEVFRQIRSLGVMKAALVLTPDSPAGKRMVGEVDKLLETMFASSRFV